MIVLKQVWLGPRHHASLTKRTISDASGKREFPPFTELAIAAADGVETSCYLFHVGGDGQVADTWHQSVDAVLSQAEWDLGAQPEEWIVRDQLETF